MTELDLLRQENNELKAVVFSFQSQVNNYHTELDNKDKQLEQFREAYDNLQHQLKALLRNRFGKRSERYIDPEHPQVDLFADLLPHHQCEQNSSENETTDVSTYRRHKRKKKELSAYPRIVVVIPVEDADKICRCGCQKNVIRYETKELLHCQPAQYAIVEERREIVACPKGCEGAVVTAPCPPHILPKVKATEEMLANLVVSKFHHRQPLYHLEKYTDTAGVSRATLARWITQLRAPLQPLINLLKEQVMDYDIASIDATTLQVLNEPGRKPETKSYLYCIRGGPPDKPVVLYDYNAKEHKQFVDHWFEGFKGAIHMDADPFFGQVLQDPNVKAVNCNAHGRRKFETIVKQAKKPGLAKEAMAFYKYLYKVERQAKQAKLGPDERYQLRQEKSKPLLEQFKTWLETHYPQVLPQSPLGKAMNYLNKHWQGLTEYLNDGRLEFDNNHTEREIKPIVTARKNFMFAYSVEGAHALSTLMSLIRSALANDLPPYDYLVAVFKAIPRCQSVEDYEKLLPWAILLD